ncbi:MAG: DHH family phosphoesterase [Clostridia bacterium]|nr:DHH family phosphoesterase [Clostridia bacterium]MBQ9774379.1 DHH family phosphoesterase [Clostridia bacterium]
MSEQIAFESIVTYLEEPADTLVLFHRAPDADAVGSAFALRQVLEGLGSRAFCVCSGEVPARLRFLMHGMQESVLPEAIPADFEVRRIVSVDCASPSQLDRLYELYEGQIDLMIDHHASGTMYADYCYIRPNAAATGEIVFDLVKQLAGEGRVRITDELCIDLYAAISGDTGCFRFSNTTTKTHMRAAELLASGIDGAEINHLLFDCKSEAQLRAEAAGISNLHLFMDGRVAVITFPYALKAALALEDEHLETLVDVARSLSGVEVAICIRQPAAEGRFRVSARSSSQYDVAELCRKFDGGGHAKAAGCTVLAQDIGDAMSTLVGAITLP